MCRLCYSSLSIQVNEEQPKAFWECSQCNLGWKISILLPDYFLSFLEAWEWDDTIDDITFIMIFWHQSMFSLDIQLAICTMSFYYYIQNLSGFCFLELLLFNLFSLIQIWIQRKNQKDSGCSSFNEAILQMPFNSLQSIECFHSRGQHLCKFIETKESVCIRKEFNSHRTGLGHQHGGRFIVLGHQHGRHLWPVVSSLFTSNTTIMTV